MIEIKPLIKLHPPDDYFSEKSHANQKNNPVHRHLACCD